MSQQQQSADSKSTKHVYAKRNSGQGVKVYSSFLLCSIYNKKAVLPEFAISVTNDKGIHIIVVNLKTDQIYAVAQCKQHNEPAPLIGAAAIFKFHRDVKQFVSAKTHETRIDKTHFKAYFITTTFFHESARKFMAKSNVGFDCVLWDQNDILAGFSEHYESVRKLETLYKESCRQSQDRAKTSNAASSSSQQQHASTKVTVEKSGKEEEKRVPHKA